MANEISVTTGLKVANGDLKVTVSTETKKFTQTTARGGGPGTVDIGTSEETISFGDIAPGFVQMKNLDATNYVDWGLTTGQLGLRLPAGGGTAQVYVGSGSLILQADTAACKVQIIALNT